VKVNRTSDARKTRGALQRLLLTRQKGKTASGHINPRFIVLRNKLVNRFYFNPCVFPLFLRYVFVIASSFSFLVFFFLSVLSSSPSFFLLKNKMTLIWSISSPSLYQSVSAQLPLFTCFTFSGTSPSWEGFVCPTWQHTEQHLWRVAALYTSHVILNWISKQSHSQSHFTADIQSVCLDVEATLRTFDQILLPFQEFGSGICCPVSVGRPLWREAGSLLC
jgi:hypothetical protein